MMRFVVVATSARGTLAKPEMLDDANQWRALVSAAAALAPDPDLPLRLATRFVQAERDPALDAQEMDQLTKGGVEAGKSVDRMVWPAVRRKVG